MLGLPWQRREQRESDAQRRSHCSTTSAWSSGPTSWPARSPYGEQRRLEIARALGTNPGVLLLDEPAAGTNPVEKRDLAQLIQRINSERNISVLLIEHDMKLVMSVAHRIVVLNFGGKIAEGAPAAIQRDPVVDRGLPRHVRPRGRGRRPTTQPELHLIDTHDDESGEPDA